MAATPNSIITPQTTGNGIATLTSPTPITSRANITGTTGLVKLTDTSTNGKKVYEIKVKAKATTSAGSLFIWRYNGTTSYLEDEILVPAVTASNTADSWAAKKTFDNLVLGPTEQLYVSMSVANDANVIACASDL